MTDQEKAEAEAKEKGWLKNHADLIERIQLLEQSANTLRLQLATTEHDLAACRAREKGWVKAHDEVLDAKQVLGRMHDETLKVLEREQKRPTYHREGRRFEAACHALPGVMASSFVNASAGSCAVAAVEVADALIAELDKKES